MGSFLRTDRTLKCRSLISKTTLLSNTKIEFINDPSTMKRLSKSNLLARSWRGCASFTAFFWFRSFRFRLLWRRGCRGAEGPAAAPGSLRYHPCPDAAKMERMELERTHGASCLAHQPWPQFRLEIHPLYPLYLMHAIVDFEPDPHLLTMWFIFTFCLLIHPEYYFLPSLVAIQFRNDLVGVSGAEENSVPGSHYFWTLG